MKTKPKILFKAKIKLVVFERISLVLNKIVKIYVKVNRSNSQAKCNNVSCIIGKTFLVELVIIVVDCRIAI